MKSNFNKNPGININDIPFWSGWDSIIPEIKESITRIGKKHFILAAESYTGVLGGEIVSSLMDLKPAIFISTEELFKDPSEIRDLTGQYITDDRIFGYMSGLVMEDFISPTRRSAANQQIESLNEGLILIFGPGASLITDDFDMLIYFDMARWEIQNRMKAGRVHGLGIDDRKEEFLVQYKRGYFVDWRVCDRLKQDLYKWMDYVLDTNTEGHPGMLRGKDFLNALEQTAQRPFSVVPYFDPGPWGGQWMKEVFDLDNEKENYAWCFNCVPEENSLKFFIGDKEFETPAINLVLTQSEKLLGESVEKRFGREFPIRFDFLDTMDGGNLSFQVHPTSEYINKTFGMEYTQDESYYLMDAKEDGKVYLGLQDHVNPGEMIAALKAANEGGPEFPAEEFVNIWPAKKHDHFLIPAGTVHCSGKNSMVLEISSTPYIFTFKMWDWNRMGMDGKPRPVNIDHAEKVINWTRTTEFAKEQLINRFEILDEGEGWIEEKTGLHELEFIETRRHWFTKPVKHSTEGSVNVLNLVEGREAQVKSPSDSFEPFIVHYAETFIIPEAVKEYIIEPYGESIGSKIATIKARIRI
jgi:mannose-6-phosphate isomerase class I